MPTIQRIAPCLWFDDQAEEAANIYVSVFPESRIDRIARYTDVGFELHGRPAGSVMTVDFELAGQRFTALNGGPVFRFNEAVSLQVFCATQQEADHFWNRLGDGGDPAAQQCGWLKDRFGVSWQIVPEILPQMMTDPDVARVRRVTEAMFQMRKLDIASLERAYAAK